MRTDITKFTHFCYNYPDKFIPIAFKCQGENIVNHLQGKFDDIYHKYGAREVIIRFYHNLDQGNRKLLEKYILTITE